MRNLIKYIILFISISTYGQDKELFGYVNVYRVANHVRAVEWSDKLTEERSTFQIDTLVRKKKETGDTTFIFHNPKGGWENVVWVGLITSSLGFDVFLDKYYGLPAFNVHEHVDVIKYIKIHMVYMWVLSPKHNKNMLKKNHKYMGADTSIKDIRFRDNKVNKIMFGQSKTKHFDSEEPGYLTISFGVINFE